MIIVAGEALIDLVVAPDGTVDAALGGAPFNAARAAARLGAAVEFVGPLSLDRFGTRLAEQLVADGVGITRAPRTELPTTLAAAELDDHGAATYRFYIDGTSAPALPAGSVALDLAPEAYFVGGLGLVLEPMADTLVEGARRMPADTLVMVDVNCRPNVIANRRAYVARVDALLEHVDVVKASDDDLAYLYPDLSATAAAETVLGRGAGAVLLTAGSKETTIVTSSGAVTVAVPPLDAPVVDTIGAGDTFAGSFLAWWTTAGLGCGDLDAERLAAAVHAAHVAAGVAVTRRGADPPRRAELPADWAPTAH